jgi:uncharacterized protein (TIGR03435 family)
LAQHATNNSLRDLIKLANNLHPRKSRVARPGSLPTASLSARPDTPGLPSLAQLQSMTQKLIVDRFQLKLSVYAITVAQGGPKITKKESNQIAVRRQNSVQP